MRVRLRLHAAFVLCLSLSALTLYAQSARKPRPLVLPLTPRIGTVTVTYSPHHPLRTFIPSHAFGAGVDGMEKGDIPNVYTPANIRAMLTTGFKPLTYRLRTELAVEAWHWNPKGLWSDPAHQQGYWISDSASESPLLVSYGYRLPRRGSGLDQANEDSYSRLVDGDSTSYWKSNPYLDAHFTHEENMLHPQWVLIDLGVPRAINTLRIFWGAPYATRYAIQYYEGEHAYTLGSDTVAWKTFAAGAMQHGHGGEETIRFCAAPRRMRFLRLLMTETSGKAPPGCSDIRDQLGYAIRELELGAQDRQGRFHDILQHGRSVKRQTQMFVSSTDPWHRAVDQDERVEQPGFDRVFASGLTNGMPLLTAVPLIYDTPENAAAQVRYLKSKGYPVNQIEMGEEPDGQYMTPEDYGALYIQWADALHQVDPALQLGGPCFQSATEDVYTWPDKNGVLSWYRRFLLYLKQRNHLADLTFFSLEWYPFDHICGPTAPQITANPYLMRAWFGNLEKDGLTRDLPWIISEYGYSSYEGEPEVNLAGALLNADSVGTFLTIGGTTAYFYGYEPNSLNRNQECPSWGNLTLFLSDSERHIKAPVAAYYGAQLLTQQWAQPGDGEHQLYAADSDIRNPQRQQIVTAYATRRPDGKWALLLLNKDPQRSATIKIRFQDANTKAIHPLTGPLTLFQYSSEQYVWHPHGKTGYARPNVSPAQSTLPENTRTLSLPPYSISVVRGEGPD